MVSWIHIYLLVSLSSEFLISNKGNYCIYRILCLLFIFLYGDCMYTLRYIYQYQGSRGKVNKRVVCSRKNEFSMKKTIYFHLSRRNISVLLYLIYIVSCYKIENAEVSIIKWIFLYFLVVSREWFEIIMDAHVTLHAFTRAKSLGC